MSINNNLEKLPIENELLHQDFEINLTKEELSNLIEIMPDTSFTIIHNPILFDTSSFICKINNQWLFWHGVEKTLTNFDWVKDMDEILNSDDLNYNSDSINQNWFASDDNSWNIDAELDILNYLPPYCVPKSLSLIDIQDSFNEKDLKVRKDIVAYLNTLQLNSDNSLIANSLLKIIKKSYSLK